MGSEKTPREYELKLTGTARDLPAFKRAVNAATSERQTWQSAELTTRYFDTPEHRLFKKGIALRIRRARGKFLQTIKAERAGGGVLNRAEWEQPVSDAEPDLKTIPKAARRKIGILPPGELHPMMALDVRRQKTIIRRPVRNGPDLEVEAVVDRGVVQAGDKSKPFSECELELLQGEPADFFRLAAEIHDACPLRVSRTTKSDRGYALLNAQDARAIKLPKFRLRADDTVNRTLGIIFEGCIGNIIDNEAAALDGKDPEGIHQLRVSVRRLRSALSVFRRFIAPGQAAGLLEELRWLASSLGPAREWDVFQNETLASVMSYGIDRGSVNALVRLTKSHRRAGYELARATLRSERYAKLILRLTAFTATEGWSPENRLPDDPLFAPVGGHAAALLERPYRKVLKAGKKLKHQSPEQRHEIRKKLKTLRYTANFLDSLYSGRNSRKFTKRLHRLQDSFGHLNDVAQAKHHVELLLLPAAGHPRPDDRAKLAAGMVLGWHAHNLFAIEKSMLRDWRAFRDVSPPWRTNKAGKS